MYLTFKKSFAKSVATGTYTITGLASEGKLPNHVALISGKRIDWGITVDGKNVSAGSSGLHIIYVTYDQPIGKMKSDTPNYFEESGAEQHVTEERLAFSVDAAKGRGVSDEKECVDAVFEKLLRLGVGYSLGRRWVPTSGVNDTGISPKPTLHHYLWRCNARTAKAECHNIAAAFALACRILGVRDSFEIGYMYPWPSRGENDPKYDKRGDSILGKYSIQYRRPHAAEGHEEEKCLFIDGNHFVNYFEGVAKYRAAVLYAIGEGRYDPYGTPDQNSSVFYSRHSVDRSTGSVTSHDLKKGGFELCFYSEMSGYCRKPYPWKTALVEYDQPAGWKLKCAPFYWHE